MADTDKVLVITGNSLTGLSTIQHLLEREPTTQIRACIRRKTNDEDLKDLPIEVITGDIMQRHLLDPVFEGVNRAYFAVPTSQDRVKVTKAFVDACFDHGVEHAVIVSVIGADTRDTVFHQQFKEIEDYVLGRADKPVRLKVGDKGQVRFRPVILRCAMFYQNIYSFVPVLKDGHLYLPLRDGSLGHVDMEDVGACIAEILVGPERFDKRTYNLVGEYQRGNIMASAISMGARVHCTYENVEPDVVIQSLKELKVQSWLADALTDLYVWFQTEQSQGVKSDIPAILGRSPTKFSAFVARDLKPVLEE